MQLGRTPRQHRLSAPLSGGQLLDAHQLAYYGSQSREGQHRQRRHDRQRGHCVRAAATLEVHLGVLSLLQIGPAPMILSWPLLFLFCMLTPAIEPYTEQR